MEDINKLEDISKLNPKKVRRYQMAVENYLENFRVGPGPNIKYTHVAMGDHFTGKFMLDKKEVKEFYRLYAEAIEYGVVFNIAEKPKDFAPLIIDVDLEIPIDDYVENTRLYNNKMIFEIINTYREVAETYLDLEPRELVASLFEKKSPTKKQTIVKDGVHIIFHGITAHFKLRHVIRNEVIKRLNDSPLFKSFTNPIEKIIDKAVVSTNAWLLPGSRKKDGQLYELAYIYDHENNSIDITNTLADKEKILKLYALQDKIRCEENASVFLSDVDFEDIEELYTKLNDKPTNITNYEYYVPQNKEDDVRRAAYLTTLLSDERTNSFEEWMRVGWALHNIDNSLLSSWIEFSKRSPKFKEGECENKWYTMRDEGLTIRSLMYWAEQDNYQKYHEFIKKEFNNILNQSLDGSTYYVAKALHSKFMDRFVFVSSKNNLWYEFRNHRWVLVYDGYTLKKEISESFVNEYLQMAAKLTNETIKLAGSEKNELTKKIETVHAIVKKLMDISFKDKIMKEAAILFHDPDFETKLDENYDLIGFSNGVYDLKSNEFREGRPDDFISKSTNVNYYPYNKENPYAIKMLKFFEEILPNPNVRRYFLLSLSSCVSGHNKEEKLRIATGSGSNGKSLLFRLVQLALGEYYISCPITIITRKRNSSNSASPELLRIKGARCGCFQETDDGEKLNVGIMKEITGNDSFMVRGLFSNPIEIKTQIKFFLACNQLPELPSVDGGVVRRICNVLFGSKFVDKPSKPNEFLIDNTLKQKIIEWAPIFASYLIHLYITEYKHLPNLIEPEEIRITTESYIAENDYFSDFYNTRVIKTGNKSDSINVKTMYDEFKAWFKGSRDGGRCPTQLELNKFLFEKMGNPIYMNSPNAKWKQFTFNNREAASSSDSDDENEQKSALDY